MDEEFIYWCHPTPPGIQVEEVSGGAGKSRKVWEAMARQIYCENGNESFRELCHFDNGAPYIDSFDGRISITHTPGLYAVASLPRTPETELEHFNTRTAVGIDAEKPDRAQAVRVREKFLNEAELALVAEDDVRGNVLLWTIKEACLKASLNPAIDYKNDIRIIALPEVKEFDPFAKPRYGKALLRLDGEEYELNLYSYLSEGILITIAYSPKCAKFPPLKKH